MEIKAAIDALAALAQESRLNAFRLLVRHGTTGLPAGEVARQLDIPHNTLSSHLAIMAQAGLVKSKREGRSIIYAADFNGTRALLTFLMEDCCQGSPKVFAPALDSVLGDCCTPPSSHRRLK